IHRCRLLHRDIKPANLILGIDGQTRVADLGVVGFLREMGRAGEASLSGQAGTLAYIAPEVFDPQIRADVRCDLYSLGVTLFQLITGRLPFGESSFFRTLIDSQTRTPRWPEDGPADMPAWFIELILQL